MPALLLGTIGFQANASVVTQDFITLSDGTHLYYTLTRPDADGRYPVVIQYDPYDSGVASDPTWNDAGYAMLGVNMRGTGCSDGTFQPLRADQWGADGAEVVDWAAQQPWSTGAVGMIGFSFTGTSQLATAAFAGPALKAITPSNVFPDFYRDLVYPGGIHNGWIPAWILAGRAYVVGADNVPQLAADPRCLSGTAEQQLPDMAQSLDTQLHPYFDEFWAQAPAGLLDRIRVPVLGCVNWQDTTVYSRAADTFRERFDPAVTWLVGSNGLHTDCAISRARTIRFFDRYLKNQANDWESTPHLLLVHELAGASGVRDSLEDDAGAWQTAFRTWDDMQHAIVPLTLFLHAGNRLDLDAPEQTGAADSYLYPTPTANTPTDWTTLLEAWGNPAAADGLLTYTTPALARDAEFVGSGSADLWIESTAADTDVQVTLSEVRPDGQEMYVANGWLRVSHRALDETRSTALRPVHTHLQADAVPMSPAQPVLARVELRPFNHVFRAGSSVRLGIDAPGGWFQIVTEPATNTIHHDPGMPSKLVLGWLPASVAQAPLPACGSLLNQPCRSNTAPVPDGTLALRTDTPGTLPPAQPTAGSGSMLPRLLLWLLAAAALGRRLSVRLAVNGVQVRRARR